MVLTIFLLFSIPIGLFAAWFGWHAWKAGRQRLAIGMGLMASASFMVAFLFFGWMWLVVNR